MIDQTEWVDGNNAYLSAALTWLRLRLEQLAPRPIEPLTVQPSTVMAEPGAALAPSLRDRLFGHRETQASAIAALPEPDLERWQTEKLQAASRELEAAAAMQPPPALVILAQRLGLSRFEQDTLLLCAATELDTRIATLCAQAQADPNRSFPTFALALALFDDAAWEALSPDRPLRYWRLIEINQPGALPLTASGLRADERVVSYLKGLNRLDDRLSLLITQPAAAHDGDVTLPPSQQTVADRILRRLTQSVSGLSPVVMLAGADTASKQLMAVKVARELGLTLCVLPLDVLPSQAGELETLSRLWERESLLLPIALYIDAHELDRGSEASDSGRLAALRRFLAHSGGVIFLDTRDAVSGLIERDALLIDISKPTPDEQRQMWSSVLGAAETDRATLLAGQFNLGVTQILKIAHEAQAEAGAESTQDAIWRLCLLRTRPRLESLAQRIDPKATLDTLVLPDRERKKLSQIIEHVRWRNKVYDDFGLRETTNRGLGISALFAGESGTGKTTAAESIANALQLNLYRIDLSAVVSKYIGETEKNLRRVFDAAEDGGSILLFDEADALFGKRSEVRDSHDRYANIEVGYLLQRMEAYNGLAILTTNMKAALDQAFVRRLRFIVDFPFPGPIERKLIWQRSMPPRLTLAPDVDVDRLARFNLSGGSIHNAAVHAAFMAAADADSKLTMDMAIEAAQGELAKLNKPMQQV